MLNKKAFITHPITLAFITFLIGMLLMFLMARGVIPVPFQICPGK